MNKYLLLLGFAGAALFSACSNSDDLSIEESPTIDEAKEAALIYEASQDSDVPIILGAGQSRGYTRAPIDPTGVVEGYGNFSTEIDDPLTTETNEARYLGVFCLATGTQETVPVSNLPTLVSQNKWKNNDESNLVVRMSNVPAKVDAGNVSFMDPDDLSAVTPKETPKVYYYPEGNWMKYSFYAYYPYDNSATLNWGSHQVQVNLTIDGSQDIIWGMANPNPLADDAFSAKYFIENGSAEIPQLNFEHKLVLFRFFVKAADGGALTTLQGLNAKVTDMKIANAIYRLSLVIANKAVPSKNGDLSKFSDETTTFHIKANGSDSDRFVDSNSDGQVDNPLDITTADAATVMAGDPVGYIMLAPPSIINDNGFKYELVVNLDTTSGPKTVTIQLDPPSGGFEAGMTYNIVINIKDTDLE